MECVPALCPANPPAAWGLDPVWNSFAKTSIALLSVAVKRALAPKPEAARTNHGSEVLVFGSGRVITRIRVLGYVVSVKDSATTREFELDDGTGLLSCVIFRNDDKNAALTTLLDPEVKLLGSLLHAGGPIDIYFGKPQLKVHFASFEHDINGEALFWLEVIELHECVFSKPFTPIGDLADDMQDQESGSRARKKPVLDARAAKLEEAVAAFALQSRTFLYPALLADPSVRAAAAAATTEREGEGEGAACEHFERAAIRHALGRLRAKGEVALADEAADAYISTSVPHDVAPAVLAVCQSQPNKEYPVNYLDIQRDARMHPVLPHANRERIELALELLVEQSKLFSTGPGSYQLVT